MIPFTTKMKSEYDTISNTKFWEVYQKRIMELLNSASTDTNTIDCAIYPTKMGRSQGKLEAFKIVLGLPNSIIKDK